MQATEGEIDTSHVSFNHRWFDLSKAPRQNIGGDSRTAPR